MTFCRNRRVAGAELADFEGQLRRRAIGQRCPGVCETRASPRLCRDAKQAVRRGSAAATRIAVIACALTSLLAGCDLPGKPHQQDRPKPANEIVDFNTLFQRNCSGCHGPDGKLGPAPPLNDPLFLAIIPDDELLRVISEGRPGTPMAAFAEEHGGPLTGEQVIALAKGLKLRFPSAVDVKEPLPAYRSETEPNAEPSADDISRGAELFARACAGCHGERGEGGDVGAVADPAFLALISDQALRRIIITGRPDLGMPHFADDNGRDDDYRPLESAQIDSIVAFLASRRQTPAFAARSEDHASEKEQKP